MDNLDVIISLTTWKGRIFDKSLPKVLFRLLTQETNYNYKVVLVLSKEEFGENFILPLELNLLQRNSKFEILWTYKNTKALKKLIPTMEKYPELPIITLDDDVLVKKDCVENIMKEHLQKPNDILGTHLCIAYEIKLVYGVRLFPAHSLVDIPLEIFTKYFHGLQDDEYNGIRAKLKGTNLSKLKSIVIENITFGNQNVALSKEHSKCPPDINGLKRDYPEYFI